MAKNITAIFNPNNIAVVGVSEDPHKLGSIYYNNLLDGGFMGKVFPVNPKHDELYGVTCYPKVSAIPDEVDQVAILIPAQFVIDCVKDCVQKNVKAVLIISAGFGELGEEGKKLELELENIAKESGISILGPNIIGVINTINKMNSSWMQLSPEQGNIAFLSQSGAFCTAILDMALNKNLGFYNFCSIGNKVDINELDLIDFWLNDNNVKVIGAYLEEVNSGYRLMRLLNNHPIKKPVLLFKPGNSKEAIQAIASHTGSMAGLVETNKAGINQSNLVEVTTTSELLSNFLSFSWSKMPQGNRVAIISNAGGPAIMATDGLIANNLKLAELSQETQEKLKTVLPPAASTHNPVDVLGDALADRYLLATDIILKDPGVDCILYILTPQYITQIEDTAKIIIRTKRYSEKPVFAVFLGEKYISIALERMYDAHVPAFNEIDLALKAIADLVDYTSKTLSIDNSKYQLLDENLNKGQFTSEINTVVADQKEIQALSDDLVAKLSTEIGLDTPRQLLTSNIDEALNFAKDIYPVVIKASNKDIAHKTDFKALYTNIHNENELRDNFNILVQTINERTGSNNPSVLIQEQIIYNEEIFIGANRDGNSDCYNLEQGRGYGHLMVIGKGGIYTEVYKDLAHVLIPATRTDFENAFLKTKISKIVLGTRAQEPLCLDKIIDTMEKFQKLLILYPQIVSIDINPLLVSKDRAVSVDIKIFVS